MLTPSGRFKVNQKICMSYSDFHPELWNPLWGVATIVIGTISFMMTDDITYGGINSSSEQRKMYARQSIEFNLSENKEFHLFKDQLEELGFLSQASIDESKRALKERKEADKTTNFLILAVISVVVAYLISQKLM